ncbi:MAG: DinB family protein [Chloroflexota bacterium]|nr:DinB family protein [Chloroflexota bacterium]
MQTSREFAAKRLAGLRDYEYFWEPTPGAWSIRRRGEAGSPGAYGAGNWRLDFAEPDPEPGPMTTIAWRLGHLYAGFALRREWTFGGREKLNDSLEFAGSATEALDRLWGIVDRWHDDVASLSEAQLDTVGFGRYPHGLDPHLPFVCIVWWMNRELIHHTAEAALLRDLWAAGTDGR